jgi:hypothetical protein
MRSPRNPVTSRHDGAPIVAASRLTRALFAVMMLIAAVIHLAPLSGVLGAEALQRLYDLRFDDPDRLVLMRHRAVLFGLIGIGLLLAIRIAAWRAPVLLAGLASTLSFLMLALTTPGINAAMQRVLLADVIAFAALVIAAMLASRLARSGRAQPRAPS